MAHYLKYYKAAWDVYVKDIEIMAENAVKAAAESLKVPLVCYFLNKFVKVLC